MTPNPYGPGDNYRPEHGHVIPALIRRFHDAKVAGLAEVAIWGTGRPMREFLCVDDMAAACLHIMDLDRSTYDQHTQPQLAHINVGYGADVSIAQLATAIARVVGFGGRITFDATKPDGTPRKLMDVSRLSGLGWTAQIALRAGVEKTYASFLAEQAAGSLRA
eukprot:gene17895-21896_t